MEARSLDRTRVASQPLGEIRKKKWADGAAPEVKSPCLHGAAGFRIPRKRRHQHPRKEEGVGRERDGHQKQASILNEYQIPMLHAGGREDPERCGKAGAGGGVQRDMERGKGKDPAAEFHDPFRVVREEHA